MTLALCIAANAALFAVVYNVLLRPLPVPEPDRLVLMSNLYPNGGVVDSPNSGVPDYYDRLRAVSVLQDQALFNHTNVAVGQDGRPKRILVANVTPSYFRVFPVRPEHGRTFAEPEGEVGNEKKVLLSQALWRSLFGGDPAGASPHRRTPRCGGVQARASTARVEPKAWVVSMPTSSVRISRESALWASSAPARGASHPRSASRSVAHGVAVRIGHEAISNPSVAASRFVERCPQDRQDREVFRPPGALFCLDQRPEAQHADRLPLLQRHGDGIRQKIVVGPAVVDRPEAVQIAEVGAEELVPLACQVRFRRPQAARVVPVHRIQLFQRPQQPGDVLVSAAVDDVQVDRSHRGALKDACRHADDDELHLVVDEAFEHLSEAGPSHWPF